MSLRDGLTQVMSLHSPTYTKAIDTQIEQVTYPTLVGADIACKADEQMDAVVQQASDNQEGQMTIYDVLVIKSDLTDISATILDNLIGYRMTLPNGKFGKVLKYQEIGTPGFVNSLIDAYLNIEIQEYQGS